MSRKPIEIDLKEVERLAGRGLTEAEICLSLGISHATLSRRKRDSEQFAAALKKGRMAANVTVANSLFEEAKNGNVTACIFWLKARAGWKESDLVVTVNDEREWSREQIMRRIDQLVAGVRAGNGVGEASG